MTRASTTVLRTRRTVGGMYICSSDLACTEDGMMGGHQSQGLPCAVCADGFGIAGEDAECLDVDSM